MHSVCLVNAISDNTSQTTKGKQHRTIALLKMNKSKIFEEVWPCLSKHVHKLAGVLYQRNN